MLTFLFLPQPGALARLCRAVLVPALTPGKGSLAEAGENKSQASVGWTPVMAEEHYLGLSIPTRS